MAVALIVLVLAIFGALFDAGAWPFVILMAIICGALAFERQHYGAAQSVSPGNGWRETEEQFVDDASGQLVRVWFNPQTGQRRYVAVDGGQHSNKEP